ncbi:phosphotransferase enzyme family protein [Xylariaceae sp. FL1019]|nr:phosphotransferase enzyme family protein [Xylariaceae sp. FL1019]
MGDSAALSIEPERVAAIMLSWSDLELISLKKTQSLWAGYGHICEVKARATSAKANALMQDFSVDPGTDGEFDLILKLISLPHTESGSEDEGHLRKMFSYQVEQYFYLAIAPQFSDKVAMARKIATTRDMAGKPGADLLDGLTATLMTDLRTKYPIAGEKRSLLDDKQAHSALDWLSTFHRESWSLSPVPKDSLLDPPLIEAEKRKSTPVAVRSLWLNGGYTYLTTRRKEYSALCSDQGSEWSLALCGEFWQGQSVAEVVADVLKMDPQSLIHGDVKSENLFTSRDGSEVAFYDFQYVGFGLGVCDLAKLFTCSVPLWMLVSRGEDYTKPLIMGEGERRLLERYHENLLAGTQKSYDWDLFVRHWETALVDWLRFQASWGFWGNTEWLEARVRSILNDVSWREWLRVQQRTRAVPNGVGIKE